MWFPTLIGGGGDMWVMCIRQQTGSTQDLQNRERTFIQNRAIHGTISQTKHEDNREQLNIGMCFLSETSETKSK